MGGVQGDEGAPRGWPEVDRAIDYQAELNPQQCEAATAPAGPSLVLAGAGSGKTRTLTYRVAYLIEQGVPADRILLLTFTNKAAREMMRRVADLVGTELSQLWGGTFHSIGARILRANAEACGFRSNFSILDREDSIALLKDCLLELEGKPRDLPKPDALAELLSRAVNERRSLDATLGKYQPKLMGALQRLQALAALYAKRKQMANGMDFDDLLALWLRLLEENPQVREQYQARFQWVLVDEYQDTNQIQSDLVDLLAATHGNLMAVGDDSQSIYSWRGANFRNILEFPKRYPAARIYRVETNYRSTPEILAVANAAIAANTAQFHKELAAARPSGMKPVMVACENGYQQADFVVQRIVQLHDQGVPLSEIAVLYRSHFHALELQLELTRRRVPFAITSGIRFFEQAHIKDVAAWLKLLVNPDDELAFKRIALLLTGIGEKAAGKLWAAFRGTVRKEGPGSEGRAPVLASALSALAKQGVVPKKSAVPWASLATTFAQVESHETAGHPGRMIRTIVEGFYEGYAQEAFPNAPTRLDDLGQLASFASGFDSLTDFLTQLSLLSEIEAEAEERPGSEGNERVRLSTVHQAKGLEFQVVLVIMLGDGLFPSARSLDDPDAEEEERRLFYVAVTRAKDELYLCHPMFRMTPGQGGPMYVTRSRFLKEIPEDLVENTNLRPPKSWESVRRNEVVDETPDFEADQEEPF